MKRVWSFVAVASSSFFSPGARVVRKPVPPHKSAAPSKTRAVAFCLVSTSPRRKPTQD